MSSGEGKKVFEAINKFRQNPSYINKTLETLKTGIMTMNPENEMGQRLARFQSRLKKIAPTPKLKMSPELCEAAENYLKKPFRRGKAEEGIKLYRGDDVKDKVPEEFKGPNTLLIDSDSYDSPDQAVINMLMDKGNPDMEDGSYLSRRILISDLPTQIGVAAEDDDDSGKFCVILSEDPAAQDMDYVPKGADKYDLTELRLAFEAFDNDNKGKIDIHKVCQLAEEMGKDKTDPTLFNMLSSLDDGKNKYITWPQFADYFTKEMTNNKNKEGRKKIYDILKPDEKYESIDYAQLKDIRDRVNLKGFKDPKIKKMLTSNTESNFGVSFQDYCDNLDKKNGPLPEYEDIQPVQPKRKKK